MLGQSRILKFVGCLGSYRNFLASRVAAGTQQQNSNFGTNDKDKLKKLIIPEAPKRPLTPFFRFLTDQRKLVQQQHPNWKVVEVTKLCADNWRKATDDVKMKYQQEYNENLELFLQKQQDFQNSLTEEQRKAIDMGKQEEKRSKNKRKMRKRYRETGKPKRPTGSFIFFIKEKQALPENSTVKLPEIINKYKHEWKTLSDENKQKYINMNNDDKERYYQEMLKWEAKMVKEGNLDVVRKESKSILLPNDQQKVKESAKGETNIKLPSPIQLSIKKAQTSRNKRKNVNEKKASTDAVKKDA